MDTAESRSVSQSQKAAARAAERKARVQAEEAAGRGSTAEVKTVNALDLIGQPGTAGQVFEVWTTDERTCLVVTTPDPVTARVIVCMLNAGTYVAKYLIDNQVRERQTVQTETITLAIETE